MAARNFIPTVDTDLLAWSQSYSAQITSAPTAVGLVAAQATQLATYVTGFETALSAVTNPSTRTRGLVEAKNVAKKNLTNYARETARIVNAFPGTTNQMRIDLGLNPRSGTIVPQPVPEDPPNMSVVSVVGRIVYVKIQGLDTTRRGKPPFCKSAIVLSYVGALPPADIRQFTFEGSTTRVTKVPIVFPASVPAGAQVWLCAAWTNSRDIAGPACYPIATHLAGGVSAGSGEGNFAGAGGAGEQLKEAA